MEGIGAQYARAGHSVVLVRGGELSSLNGCALFARLFKLLKGVEFAHIFVWGPWSRQLAAVWLACGLRGVPRGITVLDRIQANDGRFLWSRFLAGARWITAVSGLVSRELDRALPRLARVEIIPNGFDPQERAAALETASNERPAFVLCVARLRPYKGIDVLLMAWKDVCGQIEDVDLVLCGEDGADGRYQQLARRLGIASRVVFLGACDRCEVWSLLEAARCVVLASRREAFGIAVVEAMACGRAVLATRSGGPEDCIEDGATGLLVAAQDVEALREGLLRLLREPELRRSLGAEARLAAERFRWSAVARSYLDLWAPQITHAVQ